MTYIGAPPTVNRCFLRDHADLSEQDYDGYEYFSKASLIGQGWMDIFNNTTPIELNERVCLQKGAYMFQPFEKLVYIMPKS